MDGDEDYYGDEGMPPSLELIPNSHGTMMPTATLVDYNPYIPNNGEKAQPAQPVVEMLWKNRSQTTKALLQNTHLFALERLGFFKFSICKELTAPDNVCREHSSTLFPICYDVFFIDFLFLSVLSGSGDPFIPTIMDLNSGVIHFLFRPTNVTFLGAYGFSTLSSTKGIEQDPEQNIHQICLMDMSRATILRRVNQQKSPSSQQDVSSSQQAAPLGVAIENNNSNQHWSKRIVFNSQQQQLSISSSPSLSQHQQQQHQQQQYEKVRNRAICVYPPRHALLWRNPDSVQSMVKMLRRKHKYISPNASASESESVANNDNDNDINHPINKFKEITSEDIAWAHFLQAYCTDWLRRINREQKYYVPAYSETKSQPVFRVILDIDLSLPRILTGAEVFEMSAYIVKIVCMAYCLDEKYMSMSDVEYSEASTSSMSERGAEYCKYYYESVFDLHARGLITEERATELCLQFDKSFAPFARVPKSVLNQLLGKQSHKQKTTTHTNSADDDAIMKEPSNNRHDDDEDEENEEDDDEELTKNNSYIIPNCSAFILTRKPYRGSSKTTPSYKHGIHISFPYLYTNSELLLRIRYAIYRVIEEECPWKNNDALKDVNWMNAIDANVCLSTSGCRMPGSGKGYVCTKCNAQKSASNRQQKSSTGGGGGVPDPTNGGGGGSGENGFCESRNKNGFCVGTKEYYDVFDYIMWTPDGETNPCVSILSRTPNILRGIVYDPILSNTTTEDDVNTTLANAASNHWHYVTGILDPEWNSCTTSQLHPHQSSSSSPVPPPPMQTVNDCYNVYPSTFPNYMGFECLQELLDRYSNQNQKHRYLNASFRDPLFTQPPMFVASDPPITTTKGRNRQTPTTPVPPQPLMTTNNASNHNNGLASATGTPGSTLSRGSSRSNVSGLLFGRQQQLLPDDTTPYFAPIATKRGDDIPGQIEVGTAKLLQSSTQSVFEVCHVCNTEQHIALRTQAPSCRCDEISNELKNPHSRWIDSKVIMIIMTQQCQQMYDQPFPHPNLEPDVNQVIEGNEVHDTHMKQVFQNSKCINQYDAQFRHFDPIFDAIRNSNEQWKNLTFTRIRGSSQNGGMSALIHVAKRGNDDFCFNKGDKHGANSIYFHVTIDGIFQRCFSSNSYKSHMPSITMNTLSGNGGTTNGAIMCCKDYKYFCCATPPQIQFLLFNLVISHDDPGQSVKSKQQAFGLLSEALACPGLPSINQSKHGGGCGGEPIVGGYASASIQNQMRVAGENTDLTRLIFGEDKGVTTNNTITITNNGVTQTAPELARSVRPRQKVSRFQVESDHYNSADDDNHRGLTSSSSSSSGDDEMSRDRRRENPSHGGEDVCMNEEEENRNHRLVTPVMQMKNHAAAARARVTISEKHVEIAHHHSETMHKSTKVHDGKRVHHHHGHDRGAEDESEYYPSESEYQSDRTDGEDAAMCIDSSDVDAVDESTIVLNPCPDQRRDFYQQRRLMRGGKISNSTTSKKSTLSSKAQRRQNITNLAKTTTNDQLVVEVETDARESHIATIRKFLDSVSSEATNDNDLSSDNGGGGEKQKCHETNSEHHHQPMEDQDSDDDECNSVSMFSKTQRTFSLPTIVYKLSSSKRRGPLPPQTTQQMMATKGGNKMMINGNDDAGFRAQCETFLALGTANLIGRTIPFGVFSAQEEVMLANSDDDDDANAKKEDDSEKAKPCGVNYIDIEQMDTRKYLVALHMPDFHDLPPPPEQPPPRKYVRRGQGQGQGRGQSRSGSRGGRGSRGSRGSRGGRGSRGSQSTS